MMFTNDMMNSHLLGEEINRIYRECERVNKLFGEWMKAYQNFKCKPTITNAFDVEEKFMCICLRFVENPCSCLICCIYCYIPNHRNSHIRMCFQTEWNDRYANEKDGNDADNLWVEWKEFQERELKKFCSKWKMTSIFQTQNEG